ncbi:MAG: MFS transporter [Patescibacteria group bacterium]
MNKMRSMYVLSFLFSLHISLSAYVNSTFLAGIIPAFYVGILYTIASLATLGMLSQSANILKHLGNRNLVLILILCNMIGLAGLILSDDPYILGLSFVAFTVTNTLVFFCIDIFIEHFGNPRTIGKTRGLYLTILNIAWMISPLITAILIKREGGYQAIYLIALVTTAVAGLGLLFSVRKFTDSVYQKTPFLATYRYLKTNRHMLAITVINFILQFFYAWMVVYTPLYLFEHMGFGWDTIGVIFTIMLAPFVIFGLPVGILIDRYHVSKKALLYAGFLIMALSTMTMAYIGNGSIALWALVLFLTRMGASIIETTSEIYFFTHVEEKDAYLLGIYRDMNPIAYVIAPLIAILVFELFPFKYLFLVLGIIVMVGFYYAARLKETHGLISDANQ